MKFIVIHTEARIELDNAIAYYERQNVGLGVDLLLSVEKALKAVQQNPNLGSPHTKIEGVRRYAIQRFPYVIIYVELEEIIGVLAIAHRKRKPDYWKRRQFEE